MTKMMNKLALLAAVALIGSAGSAAQAAPSAWDAPSGDQGTYTYSGGETANNLFGSGNAFSDGFYFIPVGLKAQTAVATSDTSNDTLSVVLNAKTGNQFSRITSNLLGDYTLNGAGLVNSTGELRIYNLDTAAMLSSTLDFGGTVPSASEDGIFAGNTAIDLPAGWKNIRVEMDGLVNASALTGSSLIQAKDAEVGVVTTAEVPLPAAVVLAPFAAAIGWKARRKLGF